jgi:hypothetical protein
VKISGQALFWTVLVAQPFLAARFSDVAFVARAFLPVWFWTVVPLAEATPPVCFLALVIAVQNEMWFNQKKLEARDGIEPTIKVLQTFALPLGDRAPSRRNTSSERSTLIVAFSRAPTRRQIFIPRLQSQRSELAIPFRKGAREMRASFLAQR